MSQKREQSTGGENRLRAVLDIGMKLSQCDIGVSFAFPQSEMDFPRQGELKRMIRRIRDIITRGHNSRPEDLDVMQQIIYSENLAREIELEILRFVFQTEIAAASNSVNKMKEVRDMLSELRRVAQKVFKEMDEGSLFLRDIASRTTSTKKRHSETIKRVRDQFFNKDVQRLLWMNQTPPKQEEVEQRLRSAQVTLQQLFLAFWQNHYENDDVDDPTRLKASSIANDVSAATKKDQDWLQKWNSEKPLRANAYAMQQMQNTAEFPSFKALDDAIERAAGTPQKRQGLPLTPPAARRPRASASLPGADASDDGSDNTEVDEPDEPDKPDKPDQVPLLMPPAQPPAQPSAQPPAQPPRAMDEDDDERKVAWWEAVVKDDDRRKEREQKRSEEKRPDTAAKAPLYLDESEGENIFDTTKNLSPQRPDSRETVRQESDGGSVTERSSGTMVPDKDDKDDDYEEEMGHAPESLPYDYGDHVEQRSPDPHPEPMEEEDADTVAQFVDFNSYHLARFDIQFRNGQWKSEPERRNPLVFSCEMVVSMSQQNCEEEEEEEIQSYLKRDIVKSDLYRVLEGKPSLTFPRLSSSSQPLESADETFGPSLRSRCFRVRRLYTVPRVFKITKEQHEDTQQAYVTTMARDFVHKNCGFDRFLKSVLPPESTAYYASIELRWMLPAYFYSYDEGTGEASFGMSLKYVMEDDNEMKDTTPDVRYLFEDLQNGIKSNTKVRWPPPPPASGRLNARSRLRSDELFGFVTRSFPIKKDPCWVNEVDLYVKAIIPDLNKLPSPDEVNDAMLAALEEKRKEVERFLEHLLVEDDM